MDMEDLVRGCYGADDSLSATTVRALASAGIDVEDPQPSDLALVDHLHAGGAPATQQVLERLGAGPQQRLLDVGCGVGGPSRVAALSGAMVTGVDLTPEFVDAATEVTARVGLDRNLRYVAGPGESLPFEDALFDAAMMVHAGIDVPDKAAVFGEVLEGARARLSRFALYEQMATGTDELACPCHGRRTHVRPSWRRSRLTRDYWRLRASPSRTSMTARSPSSDPDLPSPFGPADVYGHTYVEGTGNNVAAARAGKLRTVLVTAAAQRRAWSQRYVSGTRSDNCSISSIAVLTSARLERISAGGRGATEHTRLLGGLSRRAPRADGRRTRQGRQSGRTRRPGSRRGRSGTLSGSTPRASATAIAPRCAS